jgi:hypothetical protein
MKNLISVFLFTILIVNGCKGVSSSHGNAHKDEAIDEGSAKKNEPTIIQVNPNMKEEKKIQQAADNGGMKWMLNPIDVVHANMITRGINVKIEDCHIAKEDDKHAVVSVKSKDGKDFDVLVERLIRPGGIWTVTQIEIKDPGRDYRGNLIEDFNKPQHAH